MHSPLVGPTTWRWVAESLTEIGHDVDVPDLREAVASGRPERFITAAAEVAGSGSAVVGHSGAGFFLPSIAVSMGSAGDGASGPRLVFVDAGLPPESGRSTPSADFMDQLRAMAIDGILPPWFTWWGAGVMESLVPDRALRQLVEAEMPKVPLSFYETSVDQPKAWMDQQGAFLLLSDSYRTECERARAFGWPAVEMLGSHLDLVNRPSEVAGAILDLVSSVGRPD